MRIGICRQLSQWFVFVFSLCMSASLLAFTLEDAIDSALKIDPTIRSSKLNQIATKENIAIARSRLLPQISLQGASSQLTQTTTQDMISGGTSSRSFTGPSVNHQLIVRQALIRPKEMYSLRYAELQTEYMELKYKYDLSELKSRVINAWIDLLCAQQISLAYERPISFIEAVTQQERAKFEQGDGTKDAVIEAEANYKNAKAAHLQALELLKAKRSFFEKLTKLPLKTLIEKRLSIEPIRSFTEAEKIDIWIKLRDASLEIQMSNLQELMQLEKVKIVEADHKPTLDLLASANLAQNDATSTQGYQYKNKQLGVQYSIPIFYGGGISAATRQAYILYESTKLDSEALNSRLENDFENLWSQVVGTSIKQNALFESYMSSLEQSKATRRSFELGVKSISDIAAIETILSRRLVELITNKQDYYRAIAKIQKSQFSIN